jgi:hypothetical protein
MARRVGFPMIFKVHDPIPACQRLWNWGGAPRARPPLSARRGDAQHPQAERRLGLPQPAGRRTASQDADGPVVQVVEWFGSTRHRLVDIRPEWAPADRIREPAMEGPRRRSQIPCMLQVSGTETRGEWGRRPRQKIAQAMRPPLG